MFKTSLLFSSRLLDHELFKVKRFELNQVLKYLALEFFKNNIAQLPGRRIYTIYKTGITMPDHASALRSAIAKKDYRIVFQPFGIRILVYNFCFYRLQLLPLAFWSRLYTSMRRASIMGHSNAPSVLLAITWLAISSRVFTASSGMFKA